MAPHLDGVDGATATPSGAARRRTTPASSRSPASRKTAAGARTKTGSASKKAAPRSPSPPPPPLLPPPSPSSKPKKATSPRHPRPEERGVEHVRSPFNDVFSDGQLKSLLAAFALLPWMTVVALRGAGEVAVLPRQAHLAQAYERFGEWEQPWKVALVLGVFAVPHALYCWLWFNAKKWQAFAAPLSSRPPEELFGYLAHCIKFAQFAALAWWLFGNEPGFATPAFWVDKLRAAPAYLASLGVARAVLAAQLVAVGQFLNSAVYATIGATGVYYGVKFGAHVPWVHGFPFSVVPDPQYLGAALTWGAVVLVAATPDTTARGVHALACGTTAFYLFSSIVEGYF